MKKINYFDFGLCRGIELSWMVNDIFPKLRLENYRAYGFEACKDYAKFNSSRFGGNPKVSIIHRAISDKEDDIKLYYSPNRVGHSIYRSKNNVTDNHEVVKGLIFSSWLLENVPDYKDCINIIKVNIEGAEWCLFNDLIETGILNNIHILCGAGHDVDKVSELDSQKYWKMIEENNIKVHRFTEHKPYKNADIVSMIQKIYHNQV